MLYRALDVVISRMKGRPYTVDRRLPLSSLLVSVTRRAMWLARGVTMTSLLAFRPALVFMGPRTLLRNLRGCRFGRNVTLEAGVLVDGTAEFGISFGDNVSIGAYSIIRASSATHVGQGLVMGHKSSCDAYSFFGAGGLITIGEDVIMGQHVCFHAESHMHASTTESIRKQGIVPQPIVIEDDCWIGANVTFLGGARVGRGSIVGAGAVVTGEFPAYSVLVGVPARVVRSRLDPRVQSSNLERASGQTA